MMSRKHVVGVISDTHGLFDPEIPLCFEGVSHILHAGDVGSAEVCERLRKIAPVTAVSGNVDLGRSFHSFKPHHLVELFGLRIWLVHILGDPHQLPESLERALGRLQPQVVVFGHSHQPFAAWVGPVFFFNP